MATHKLCYWGTTSLEFEKSEKIRALLNSSFLVIIVRPLLQSFNLANEGSSKIPSGSDEAQFWLNGYVNKQNCRIWSEANPQVYVETPLHPEKLTVWCALWAGGILLQKR
ncbi:hypothetical protein TNCV_2078001 [Trichonephila clavipes]|nr:hypothetical protein TNCV_2078001 [Trichonephila clavipes]